MNTFYDSRFVPAHDEKLGVSVLLMNEALGLSEVTSGIPSFGQQGANIFHALRFAGISWAIAHPKFVWPRDGETFQSERHRQKAEFLADRARHITCTNAFPHWPKPTVDSNKFCPPDEKDVVSHANIARIRREVQSTHRTIMVCGAYAYLACIGKKLLHPNTREATELTATELCHLNKRLSSQFEKGWYMGHTRRRAIRRCKTAATLRVIAQFTGWPLETNSLFTE